MANDEKQDAIGQPQTQEERSSVVISLHIKSLERTTHSVSLPRNSTVLQLKEHIQAVSQVDSQRQRLIFQGRVLKDDKSLLDYANLDDGKVVHLVIRPTGVPHNPDNDDPNNTRENNARGLPRARHPMGGSRFPAMEGYAFITLDTTMGEMSDPGSIFFNLLNGISNNGAQPNTDTETSPVPDTPQTGATTNSGSDSNPARIWHRISRTLPVPPPTAPRTNSNLRNRTNSEDSIGSEQSRNSTSTSGPGTPFTSNIEYRLSRTMSSIRNVRQLLDTPVHEEIRSNPTATFPNPTYVEEIRRRLRSSGDSPTAQVGVVVDELADLLTDTIPRLRDLSRGLRNETEDTSRQEQERLQLMALRSARITQGLSLINHFLGSVLGSAELEDRPQDTHVRLSGRGALDSWLSYVRNGNIGGINPAQPPSSQESINRSPITPLRATSHIQNSAATNETIRRALRAADIDDAQIQRLLSPTTSHPTSNNTEPTAPSGVENRKRKQSEVSTDNDSGQNQGESSSSTSTNADTNKKMKADEDSFKGKQKKD
ncbi:hypothetical protein INT43_004433 [Umbelopsis isabellina]|uniref:Ubiquitin-like domain-containing protein n=1 Tax=Mortierella isabellina TaxID=91625 RepID=A0A8H7U994_MORIS|nr:hypothetical protein INT43_004433 [Umbelopsis isabellina]